MKLGIESSMYCVLCFLWICDAISEDEEDRRNSIRKRRVDVFEEIINRYRKRIRKDCEKYSCPNSEEWCAKKRETCMFFCLHGLKNHRLYEAPNLAAIPPRFWTTVPPPPPNASLVIDEIDDDAKKFAAKFEQDLLSKSGPGSDISEAGMQKMLKTLNWSNYTEVCTVLVTLFSNIHRTHEAYLKSIENTINNTMSNTLRRSIINYNQLLENLLEMHENRSIASTEFPIMTEAVAIAAGLLMMDLETMMRNIIRLQRDLRMLLRDRVERFDLLKKFVNVSKQNAEIIEESSKTIFNEFQTLESNEWNEKSIDENYKNEIARLKAKKYSVSNLCAFGEGFLAGFTLGMVVVHSCEENAVKKEKERLNEIADLTNKERTVEQARKVIDKRLSKLNKTLYESYCVVEILKLIDPEIQQDINKSSIKLGKASVAIEEIDKIVDKLEEMKTEGRLVLDSMDLKDYYLLEWGNVVNLLGRFADKAHSIFEMKQNPFRGAIGGDEWFDLQSSILNILRKD